MSSESFHSEQSSGTDKSQCNRPKTIGDALSELEALGLHEEVAEVRARMHDDIASHIRKILD